MFWQNRVKQQTKQRAAKYACTYNQAHRDRIHFSFLLWRAQETVMYAVSATAST
jgi:hypothetical protein